MKNVAIDKKTSVLNEYRPPSIKTKQTFLHFDMYCKFQYAVISFGLGSNSNKILIVSYFKTIRFI